MRDPARPRAGRAAGRGTGHSRQSTGTGVTRRATPPGGARASRLFHVSRAARRGATAARRRSDRPESDAPRRARGSRAPWDHEPRVHTLLSPRLSHALLTSPDSHSVADCVSPEPPAPPASQLCGWRPSPLWLALWLARAHAHARDPPLPRPVRGGHGQPLL